MRLRLSLGIRSHDSVGELSDTTRRNWPNVLIQFSNSNSSGGRRAPVDDRVSRTYS